MIRGIEYYIQAGRHLHALKRRVGHGDWMKFLENAGIHQKAAERYMLLASHDRAVLAASAASDSDEPMSLRGALEVVRAARADPVEDESITGGVQALLGKAKNITPKRKQPQDTHMRLMKMLQRTLVEIRTAAHEASGSEVAGIIGYGLAEFRSLEHALAVAIEGEANTVEEDSPAKVAPEVKRPAPEVAKAPAKPRKLSVAEQSKYKSWVRRETRARKAVEAGDSINPEAARIYLEQGAKWGDQNAIKFWSNHLGLT